MTGRQDPDTLRVDEIVLEAAALDPGERSAYLERLDAEGTHVMAEARRLLRAAAEVSDSFLEGPAFEDLETHGGSPSGAPSNEPAASPDDRRSERPVHPEDRYTVGPRLGRGGMAEVFCAYDHQLERPVALKLLSGAEPADLARCLREARAQARVHHPHVLDVYDTGELEGRPFLALRLVDGPTLPALREETSLEQQVALLIQVAEGLDAAHRQGLVHQDVKPSNVLVEAAEDGELRAWVSDFGIATAVELGDAAGDVREEGRGGRRLVGTLPYLAPERLVPDATPDRRGDVWSLGVLMYELFTGELPFTGSDPIARLRAIRRREPRPPREIAPSLPRDLEAIVQKCLAKDPEARYPTAREVARDLQRFLDGDVVEAHAASWAYRLTRFALRHRIWVRVVAVISALLLVALVTAAWLGWRAMRSEERAVARQGQAEELIGFMLLDLRGKLDRLGRLELIDDVGAEAMRYFAAVEPEELSDEELARYATALHQLGEVRTRRGELDGALEAFEQSLTLARASHRRDRDNPERLFELGQSQFWVGSGHRQLGDHRRARAAFESYLDTSRQLASEDPGDPRWRLELAYAHANLGTLLRDVRELAAAHERFRESYEIIADLAAASPTDLDLQSELAWAHHSLGDVLLARGENELARRHFLAELAIRRELVEARPGDARWRNDLAVTHNYLGHSLAQSGAWRAASEHLEEALSLHRSLAAEDPTNQRRRLRQAILEIATGRAALALGATDRAAERLHDAAQWLGRVAARPDATVSVQHRRELAWARLHLARLAWPTDRPEAWDHLAAAERTLESLLAEIPADRVAGQRLAIARIVRGSFAHAAGDATAAREAWRKGADRLEPSLRDSRDPVLRAWWRLVQARLGAQVAGSPRDRTVAVCEPLALAPCTPSPAE